MIVARQHGLVFNVEKCQIKVPHVTFFRTVYDRYGAHPNPGKVDAIKNIEAQIM